MPPKRCRRDTPCEGRGKLSGVPAFDQIMDDEQRARTRAGMSLAEVGLALKSHLLAPRSEPAASVVNFVLRHSGLERG